MGKQNKAFKNKIRSDYEMNLLHLSEPKFGGWVSYTAHLMLRDYSGEHIYKTSKRLEKKTRDFGFGVRYQNIPKEAMKMMDNQIVLSFDPKHEDCIPYLNEPTLLMHDTAEPKRRLTDFYQSCKRIIVNRKTLKTFLKEEYELESDHVEMPFNPYPIPETDWSKKTKALNLARVEYRKNQDIICIANQTLGDKFIEIYGKRNLLYVFHNLKDLGFDKYARGQKNTGAYPHDFETHTKMLEDCKFVVDLAKYVRDGGGMQYTFLEAIHLDCALILHRDWINQPGSDWKEGYNCFGIDNPNELTRLIQENPDTEKICRNAKKLLDKHINSEFNF